MYDNNNQNNIEWYRSRLGYITGSAVGNIMGTPRSKSEEWTTTAQSYLNVIAFERTLNPIVVQNDDLFSEYLSITEVHNKILDWGHTMEGEAAHLFAKTYNKKYGDGSNTPIELDEPPSVKSDSLPNFSSSPDRMYYDNEAKAFYAIEIKCPLAQKFHQVRQECIYTRHLRGKTCWTEESRSELLLAVLRSHGCHRSN